MKRFYSVMGVALAGVMAANAYTVKPETGSSVWENAGKGVSFRVDGNQAAGMKSDRAKVFGKLPAESVTGRKAPAREGEEFNVITTPPAGETLTMCGSSISFFVDYGEVMQDEWDGLAYDAVVTEDGDFYLKNPMSRLQWDTYIKGKITDEGVTFEFPQPLYRIEDEEMGVIDLYAEVLEYAEIEVGIDDYVVTFIPAEDTRTITFEKDEDGNYAMLGDNMLGVVNSTGNWQGFGEYQLVLKPFKAEKIEVPADIKYDYTYVLADEIFGWDHTILRPMAIGFDGSDAYLKGISLAMPDAVVKGSFDAETQILSIPTNQFMGQFYNYYIFMMVGDGYEYYDPSWDSDMIETNFTDEPLRMLYDAETNVYTPIINEEDHFAVMFFNFGNTNVSPCEYYEVNRIYSQGEITDYAPLAPQIEDIYSVSEFDPNYSYCIEFMVFADNADGQMLMDSNIYYNIFINGELYPLTVEEFPGLANFGIESITDIPASLSDDDDIYASGNFHGIAFRNQNISTIGIRAVYIADGVRGESEIVTVEAPTNGVENVGNSLQVVSEEYFDVAGRRLSGPVAGSIVLRRAVMSDGTVKTSKVMMRK
ncbi:MAG: hypothetical protein K2K26_05355 [Muribaculaceae bacterium]|nr:hypothetical protein [Muribaculaceae bacterium]